MNQTQKLPALVLAAGLSSRMGDFKPLVPLAGKALIGHVIDALRGSGCVDPIVVVTGHRAAALSAALPAGVATVHNADFAGGEMLSSLRTGLNYLQQRPHAAWDFMLCLADQPAVLSSTIQALVEAHRQSGAGVTIPTYGSKKGHPLILASALVPEILALSATDTLRTVVQRHLPGATMVPVNDPAVLEDLDTPADLARAEARLASLR